MDARHPIGEGSAVLRELLRARGVDPETPRSIDEAWPVFKEFIAIRFATDGADSDGVLYESGTYAFGGPEAFQVDFVRQFQVVDETGEHDHFEQLRCEFLFDPNERTGAFRPFHLWWFRGGEDPTWPAFVAQVEQRVEFQLLRSASPRAVRIEQERV